MRRDGGEMEKKSKVYAPLTGRERTRRAVLTVLAGGAVNLILFFVKLYIGLASNSLAILTDAVNNLSDSLGFAIAALGFSAVSRRADGVFSYGYGRAEYLADFIVAVIVCAVGASFLYKAVERFVLPYLMTFTWGYFAVIAATVAVKLLLGVYFRKADSRINSGTLKGASLDSFIDAGITAMTLIGFALNRYSKLRLDALFGLVIGVIMIVNGLKLLFSAAKKLLGTKLSRETEKDIADICASCGDSIGVRSVALHDYGAENKQLVIDAVFTNEKDFDKIINITEEISRKVKEKYGYDTKVCVGRSEDETRS